MNTMKSTRLGVAAVLVSFALFAGQGFAWPRLSYHVPKHAYLMHLADNWEISGALPTNALLISLQGLANRDTARLYFVYPPSWPYTFTEAVMTYYRDTRHIRFEELKTPEEALKKLHRFAKGYVVWDKNVRTSLIVAFTAAGLEDAVVVTEDLVPLVEQFGLKKIDDYRGRFVGKSDYAIYHWAYAKFWDRTNKDLIVWLGGVGGNKMQPGIADFGIMKRVFFTDLSADPHDSLEYRFADSLLSQMNPMTLVMGWHSYAKDTEDEHITLLSHHGFRMEGLNTLPNMSFSHHIPTTPGHRFRNNHNVKPHQKIVPKKKVYIACIQSDGLGIGAWLKPGRGEIPYAWEVTMNWIWLAPGMLQYFYDMATPNDYFIGALSGPGYLYPKAVPPELLPGLVREAWDLMKALDLRVFETMDYSEGNRYYGNIDLPKRVLDVYYREMPHAIGFVNGYGPANTYDVRNGRPFISYSYYLSPDRPAEEAVNDLRELARMNPKRPYFLLMHVRESSDIKRVKGILDELGPEFEVVPLDVFLRMAGTQPTFRVRRLDEMGLK